MPSRRNRPRAPRVDSTGALSRAALAVVLALACLPACVTAWGVAGHEIIATIAQIHLHPTTRATIARMLPEYARGHLAPVAAWADRIRIHERWSGSLHYISPLDDDRWRSPRNVLHVFCDSIKLTHRSSAISNYTQRIADRVDDQSADIDLRFLVHFIGDVHQPLHLMERERGGNGDPVLFERRHMSLHGLWDTQMVAKSIRELTNYTRPLPSPQIESALRGSIYDSYVRWILWEGVRVWWRDELADWLACPRSSAASGQHVLGGASFTPCSFAWAAPAHNITCSYVFPPTLPLPELATPEYYGVIKRDKILERQLAMGGLRLAATLNTLLASPLELASVGVLAAAI